jgi:hypothetical protein
MNSKYSRLILAGLSLAGCLGVARAEPPIPPERFAKLFQVIQPRAEEQRWTQIPWQTNLWEARRQAAAAGKPILLWEMDGHPLGCT